MRQTAERAAVVFQGRVRSQFDPLERHLKITGEWGKRGALDLDDHRRLNTLFIPMLEQYPAVNSMLIANEHGREYMLLREPTAWLTRSTDADGDPGRVEWRRWSENDSLIADWWEDVDYDPRRRRTRGASRSLRRSGRGRIACHSGPANHLVAIYQSHHARL